MTPAGFNRTGGGKLEKGEQQLEGVGDRVKTAAPLVIGGVAVYMVSDFVPGKWGYLAKILGIGAAAFAVMGAFSGDAEAKTTVDSIPSTGNVNDLRFSIMAPPRGGKASLSSATGSWNPLEWGMVAGRTYPIEIHAKNVGLSPIKVHIQLRVEEFPRAILSEKKISTSTFVEEVAPGETKIIKKEDHPVTANLTSGIDAVASILIDGKVMASTNYTIA